MADGPADLAVPSDAGLDATGPGDGSEVRDADAVAEASDGDAGRGAGDADDAARDASAPGDADAAPAGDVAHDAGLPDAACPTGASCELPSAGICEQGQCNATGQCVAVPVEGCCNEDAECTDQVPASPCESFECIDHACEPVSQPGCCASPSSCDDQRACTEDRCAGPGARCFHCPGAGCDCPVEAPHREGFDTSQSLDALGYAHVDDSPFAEVRWRRTTRRAATPPGAIRVGREECATYYPGDLDEDCQPAAPEQADAERVRTTLAGPSVALPDAPGGYVALMAVWADVEPLAGEAPKAADLLTVLVDDGSSEPWTAATSAAVGRDTQGAWRRIAVDLTPWTGETIRMRYRFDTLDADDNHHEGVYLDDLRIVPRCRGGCCELDDECDDVAPESPCRRGACVELDDGAGSICTDVARSPGEPCQPCEEDAGCDDGEPCTEDVCAEGGFCRNEPFCCVERIRLDEGFEQGLGAWFEQDEQPDDGVSWRITEATAAAGSAAAGLFDPDTGTYATSGPVRAELTSPFTLLPEPTGTEERIGLSFWLRLSTEWDGQLYDNPAGLDRLHVEVLHEGETTEVWSSDAVEGSTGGEWVPVEVDLAEWAGEEVKVRFTFDTVDGQANDHAGPRIDGVRMGRFCL